MSESYSVVLFHTSSAVLRAEKLLLRAGLRVKLIPVPRQLSSDCGISLRFESGDEARLREILAENKVTSASIHPLTQ